MATNLRQAQDEYSLRRALGQLQFYLSALEPLPIDSSQNQPTPPSSTQQNSTSKLKTLLEYTTKLVFSRRNPKPAKADNSLSHTQAVLDYDWSRHEIVLREDQDWTVLLEQAQYLAKLETKKIEDHQVIAHLKNKKPEMDALAAKKGHLDPASALGTQLSIHLSQSELIARQEEQNLRAALKRGGHAAEFPLFELIDFIGKGSFGRVFAAWDRTQNPNRLVAVKIMDIDSVDYKADHRAKDQSIAEIQHEAKVLGQLKGFRVENVNMIYQTFVVHTQLWIVSELCAGGSVKTLMRATGEKLEEKYILPIFREMSKGLRAIHEAGIMHRDIKSSNIMILEEGRLQIIDFGIAATFETKEDKRMTLIGTPHWMAPELHKRAPAGGLKYGVEVDVWGAGMVGYEMATGLPAHARVQGVRQLATALTQNPPRLSTQQGFSQGLCDLIEFTLQPKPEKRPSMESVLTHPYFTNSEQSYPTVMLAELVNTYKKWEAAGGQRLSLFYQAGAAPADFSEDIISGDQDEWRFSRSVNYGELPDFQSDSYSDAATARTEAQILPTLQVESATESSSAQPRINDHHQLTAYTTTEPSRFHTTTADHGAEARTSIPNMVIDYPSDRDANAIDAVTKPNLASAGQELIEKRAERGGQALASIFQKDNTPYEYKVKVNSEDMDLSKPILSRAKSDLPLRNNNEFSRVHSKELFVPDAHNQSRPGSNPDIDLANVGTIKQNRMLSKFVGGSGMSSSESSGEDGFEHEGNTTKKAKRDTMAWEPEWDKTDSAVPVPDVSSWDSDYNRPAIGADDGNSEASASAPSRPVLHHAETAPVGVQFDGPSRGSVVSVLDMDALLGDAAWPTSNTMNVFTQEAEPSLQDEDLDVAGHVAMAGAEQTRNGIWASHEVALLNEDEIRARIEDMLDCNEVTDQLERKDLMRGYLKQYREEKDGFNLPSNDTTNGRPTTVAHARAPSAPTQFPELSAPILPPHPDVMASNSLADRTIAEVSRMILAWNVELGAVDSILDERWGLSSGTGSDQTGMEDYGMGNDDNVEDHDADVEGN